ncbi:MAG: GHKL domain-containing protein [Proteobacteria bacterium]|nr:GHKL domain-containing protein [Pseudomonadota bacterium]
MIFPKIEKSVKDLRDRIKWLILLRLIVSFPLLIAIVFFQINQSIATKLKFAIFLWGITGLFLLSFLYALSLVYIKGNGHVTLAYAQIIIDTFIVSLIIYITGGFFSFFQFLYFVIIIYSSMLLLKKGSLVMASLCSVQYGILIDLEYYGFLNPFGFEPGSLAAEYVWSLVFYKILFTMISCFAVAILSSLLAIEIIKARKELNAMEANVQRVEKMAAVGEMAAGLAHEIKNPLASLSGAIQLLREESSYHPDSDKLMKIALREAGRLSSLLNDFLMFARPKAGNPMPLKVDKALEEILDLFSNDPGCKDKATLKRDLVPGIWIAMDPGHLHQVIWNLLMNAVQAISQTGEIGVKMDYAASNYINIEISDNGCGMTPETIKSIFDPFYTTKKKGVGLGLSIVHRIVESYGGRIDVTSAPGEGTTFTLGFTRLRA